MLTLRAALLESNNRAATALQQRVGSKPVLRLASHVGLRDMPDVPSLSLGTGLVTPLELTAAFAMFPNGGLAVTPRAIVRVSTPTAAWRSTTRSQSERVISVQTAFQMVSMLGDVIDRGTGAVRAPRRRHVSRRREDGHDERFQGRVVRRFLVEPRRRRVGRLRSAARRSAARRYGSRYAAPIWTEFMRRAARMRPARAPSTRPAA